MTEAVEVVMGKHWRVKVPEHRSHTPWDIWEIDRLQSMHKNIKPGNIVFDVGSEEGDMSALYALWGATVVPFEPNPLVWPCFRLTWESNNLAPPAHYFVGFAANETSLNPPELLDDIKLPEKDGWPGCAYLPVISDHGFRNETERGNDTPKIKLDEFADKHDVFPDAITMDVEGAEFEVLKGAETILRLHKPLVWVSLHPEFIIDKYPYKPYEVHMWMWKYGYMGTLLDTQHEHHWFYWPKEIEIKL